MTKKKHWTDIFLTTGYQYADKVYANGLMGKLNDVPFVVYCNEKEYRGKGFFFGCCKGCKHNPIND